MSRLVADHIVERLRESGVHRVYGYPGDGIDALLGAFDRAGEDPELIEVRHEAMAAFMACAHAKFTGEVGVCVAASGPDAVHLLNGLYDAKLDHAPVVAIVGQQERAGADVVTLFEDVAHEYVQIALAPDEIPHLIDRAVHIALSQQTVTCVIVPNDLAAMEAVEEAPQIDSSIGHVVPKIAPPDSEIRRAAEILNEGEKVAILVGQGALGATDEVIEIADILGAGIAKALLGKAAVPDDISYVTGSIGLLGTRPSWELMNGCDTLLTIGSSFLDAEFLPHEGQARAVQIDNDARRIGVGYPIDVRLVGDAAETLRALIPLLITKEDRSWREGIVKGVQDWWHVLADRAQEPAIPVNPHLVFWELSPRLPDNCIVTSDSGSAANWFARDVKLRSGMSASLSGALATTGPGVPYAIAAKFAHPDRPVIALVGDGATQLIGFNELITIAKHWRRWENPTLVVLVLNCRALDGDPRYPATQRIPDFPYARFAELVGLKGVRVDDPDRIGDAWEDVLNADRPAVLEAVTDPELANGDPDPDWMTRGPIRHVLDSLTPGH